MPTIVLIAHNLRSCHNVGSLLRTAEGLGIQNVFLTGYTPYPIKNNDTRLPHLSAKITRQIQKTALGAEKTQSWQQNDSIQKTIAELQAAGFIIVAVEQTKDAVSLPSFQPSDKVALLVGREVEGVEPEVLALCKTAVEIPMFGKKESYNVVQAAAMVMYHCRFYPFS